MGSERKSLDLMAEVKFVQYVSAKIYIAELSVTNLSNKSSASK